MGADSLDKSIQNAPEFICPICLPNPKSLGFQWKKASLGVRSPWCWLLAKSLSNFLPLPWKLNNRCYHTFKTRYTNTLKFSKQIITCCTIFTRLWVTFIYVSFTICIFKSIFTITGVRRINMICTGNSVCLWTWVWLAWTVRDEFVWAILTMRMIITKLLLFNTLQR